MRGTVRTNFAKRACGLELRRVHKAVLAVTNEIADKERGGGDPCFAEERHGLQIAPVPIIEGDGHDGITAVPARIQCLAEADELDARGLKDTDLGPKQRDRKSVV